MGPLLLFAPFMGPLFFSYLGICLILPFPPLRLLIRPCQRLSSHTILRVHCSMFHFYYNKYIIKECFLFIFGYLHSLYLKRRFSARSGELVCHYDASFRRKRARRDKDNSPRRLREASRKIQTVVMGPAALRAQGPF